MTNVLTPVVACFVLIGCADDSGGSRADERERDGGLLLDASSAATMGDSSHPPREDASVMEDPTPDAAPESASALADAGAQSGHDAARSPDASAADGGAAFTPCVKTTEIMLSLAPDAGCSLPLPGAPTHPTYLVVRVDGAGVYEDRANGFGFLDGILTFYGEWCDQVSGGQAHDLQVTLYCQ